MITMVSFLIVLLLFIYMAEVVAKDKRLVYLCNDCDDSYTLAEMSDDNGSRCLECEHNYQTGFNDENLFV